jgi:hypothetical protein
MNFLNYIDFRPNEENHTFYLNAHTKLTYWHENTKSNTNENGNTNPSM